MALFGAFGLPALASLASLLGLAVTSHAAPARTVAGVFVSLTVVLALQIVVGAFLGRRAALGVGAAVALLTVVLVSGAPPEVALQETQWQLTLSEPQVVAHTILARPPSSRIDMVGAGARAELLVCLPVGEASDIAVRMNGLDLQAIVAPFPSQCWKHFAVPPAVLVGAPDVLQVTVHARDRSEVVLTGGYTRPSADGGRSGGAAISVAGRQTRDDLSPTAPGAQVGRYFVELRVFDRDERIVEIWY